MPLLRIVVVVVVTLRRIVRVHTPCDPFAKNKPFTTFLDTPLLIEACAVNEEITLCYRTERRRVKKRKGKNPGSSKAYVARRPRSSDDPNRPHEGRVVASRGSPRSSFSPVLPIEPRVKKAQRTEGEENRAISACLVASFARRSKTQRGRGDHLPRGRLSTTHVRRQRTRTDTQTSRTCCPTCCSSLQKAHPPASTTHRQFSKKKQRDIDSQLNIKLTSIGSVEPWQSSLPPLYPSATSLSLARQPDKSIPS